MARRRLQKTGAGGPGSTARRARGQSRTTRHVLRGRGKPGGEGEKAAHAAGDQMRRTSATVDPDCHPPLPLSEGTASPCTAVPELTVQEMTVRCNICTSKHNYWY